MFFKAVNKFTGAIDGWGKDPTRERYEEHWDMAQVDVVEITEDEFNQLFEDAHRRQEECRKGILHWGE